VENVPGTSHMCLKCAEWKHGRQMDPVLSMSLTCSHPFPGALAPSVFRQGEGFCPYPEEQEVFLRSNTDTCNDKSWHKLGLNDFVITNVWIGHHRFSWYSNVMVEHQRGFFNRGLESWDLEECESLVLEVSLGYTASMGMMLFEQNELQCRRVCDCTFFCDLFADCCFRIDTLSNMAMDRDEAMFKMQQMLNDQEDELCRFSRHLRELMEELWELRCQVPVACPVEIVDLTGDDNEGIVVGEDEEPLVVRTVERVERTETVVPDSEAGTLVEIQEDCRATPQVIGEAERAFAQMERGGSVEQRAWDEEADYVVLLLLSMRILLCIISPIEGLVLSSWCGDRNVKNKLKNMFI